MIGSSSTSSGASGAIVQTLAISGSSATVSSGNGTFGLKGVIAGSSATASTASGAIVAKFVVSGYSATASSASGALGLTSVISGSSATVSSATGSISRALAIAGSSATTSSASGAVTIQAGAQTYPVTGSSVTPSIGVGAVIMTLTLAGSSATLHNAVGFIYANLVISGVGNTPSQGFGSFSAVTSIISGTSVTASAGFGTFKPITLFTSGISITASWAQGAFMGATVWDVNGFTKIQSSGIGALKPSSIYVPPTSGSYDEVWVEILNSNLVSLGPIQFVSVNAQLYYNAVGSWTVIAPYSDGLWNIVMAGDFIVHINWRGLFTFGGKCENPSYSDSIPGATSGAAGAGPYITLTGADYLALIANRIAYPSPGVAWSAQSAAATDPVSSMKLETAIKHYVNNNMGPATSTARRMSLMDIAPDLARGAAVSYTVKFGSGVDLNLLDVIRALISATGNGNSMGVQVTRNAATHRLTFDVYIPRDLTGKAWFSQIIGNLTAINFNIVDPTVTDALVQGSGTTFIQKTATGRTQWNVVEAFTDSSGETDVNNLNTSASDSLLQGQAGPTMNITATDIPFLTYGRDYRLGDIVSVEVRPGVVYSDVVTGVALVADPGQTPSISVVPTIGQNSNSTATDQTIIGQLTARIRALEKKLATK